MGTELPIFISTDHDQLQAAEAEGLAWLNPQQ